MRWGLAWRSSLSCILAKRPAWAADYCCIALLRAHPQESRICRLSIESNRRPCILSRFQFVCYNQPQQKKQGFGKRAHATFEQLTYCPAYICAWNFGQSCKIRPTVQVILFAQQKLAWPSHHTFTFCVPFWHQSKNLTPTLCACSHLCRISD